MTGLPGHPRGSGEHRLSPIAGASWWFLLGMTGLSLLAFGALGTLNVTRLLVSLLQILFVAFFLRHLSFVIAAGRSSVHPRPIETAPACEISVSVIVPCHNEASVADGLVGALLKLDYPAALCEFVLVDDGSTDATPEILDRWAARESRLSVLHRSPASGGGKSGALNSALPHARGDVLVIFDADHQPKPDALRYLLRHFSDPAVAAVQGCCRIRNSSSLLARLIHIDYLAGYHVNEFSRQSVYGLPAYGGANCAVRRTHLQRVSGWNENSVTEDTDLTIRLMLSGYRVRYEPLAVDEEEGVTSLARFWRQRYRWARGHQAVCRRYLLPVLRSRRLTLREKYETVMFLLVFHVPVFNALGLLISLGVLVGGLPRVGTANRFSFFLLWTLLLLGPLLELAAGLLLSRSSRSRVKELVFFFPIFAVSIALCTRAWFDALVGRSYDWIKTAREADLAAGDG